MDSLELILIAIGGGVVLLLGALLLWCWCRKRRRAGFIPLYHSTDGGSGRHQRTRSGYTAPRLVSVEATSYDADGEVAGLLQWAAQYCRTVDHLTWSGTQLPRIGSRTAKRRFCVELSRGGARPQAAIMTAVPQAPLRSKCPLKLENNSVVRVLSSLFEALGAHPHLHAVEDVK